MPRVDANQTLQKLITIKKKRAEQRLAEVQIALQKIDLEAQEIELVLSRESGLDGFDAFKLAVRNRFPERMLQTLENLRSKRLALTADMGTAEDELKVALHAARELRGAVDRLQGR